MNYDVAIIGGGISGLMLAYRTIQKNEKCNIVIIEKGKDIEKRVCPVLKDNNNVCMKCQKCSIMNGMAGAGAFSDGKYIITSEYGGWLQDYIGSEQAVSYMEEADRILVSFGATSKRFLLNADIKKKCLQNGLYMKAGVVKHLGTDKNLEIMSKLIDSLKPRVTILSECEVTDVCKDTHIIEIKDKPCVHADTIVFAVGRSGSTFLTKWCEKNSIEVMNNTIDIGVRVELNKSIWDDISSQVYDPKITYKSKKYGDITRMFCFNEGGQVVCENTEGVITVNGHAYADPLLKTQNSNFALLSTIKFSEPFNKPLEYIKNIAKVANYIGGGNVLVQKFGDLCRGQRTTYNRLAECTTVPTLKAVPGDLSLCIPKRQLDNIIETIIKLDSIAPGTANYDTLLYGLECKYYSARPTMTKFQLEKCTGIFACGDGAGITRSLAQAAANGLFLADILCS